jgi:threonine/homoserine/homoserine lactone efflux protein
MLMIWIKGLILGFSIAAPVGPIGLLCIRRSLTQGRLAGFLSGMGAATADGLYGAMAAFGLTAVFAVLTNLTPWLRVFGGLYLLWLGWHTLRQPPAKKEAASSIKAGDYWGAYVSTFLFTLSNPVTIFTFLAIFSGAGLPAVTSQNWGTALWMVVGVFCGSALWWLILSHGVSGLAAKLNAEDNLTFFKWVNRFAGVGIMAFAIYNLGGLFM